VQRSSPFGKPPKAIVSPDGNVYFHWEFHRDPVFACSTINARPFMLTVPPPSEPSTPKPSTPPFPGGDPREQVPPGSVWLLPFAPPRKDPPRTNAEDCRSGEQPPTRPDEGTWRMRSPLNQDERVSWSPQSSVKSLRSASASWAARSRCAGSEGLDRSWVRRPRRVRATFRVRHPRDSIDAHLRERRIGPPTERHLRCRRVRDAGRTRELLPERPASRLRWRVSSPSWRAVAIAAYRAGVLLRPGRPRPLFVEPRRLVRGRAFIAWPICAGANTSPSIPDLLVASGSRPAAKTVCRRRPFRRLRWRGGFPRGRRRFASLAFPTARSTDCWRYPRRTSGSRTASSSKRAPLFWPSPLSPRAGRCRPSPDVWRSPWSLARPPTSPSRLWRSPWQPFALRWPPATTGACGRF
jgi:hypothetical protein